MKAILLGCIASIILISILQITYWTTYFLVTELDPKQVFDNFDFYSPAFLVSIFCSLLMTTVGGYFCASNVKMKLYTYSSMVGYFLGFAFLYSLSREYSVAIATPVLIICCAFSGLGGYIYKKLQN